MNRFKKYLVPALAAGAVVLGMDAAMASTIDTAALPGTVDTALKAVGFAGLTTWVVGILALVAGITAAFAGARLIKRGGNSI